MRIDAVGNVIAERPGEPGEPVVVISGHLDTVFPEGTDVTVKREGTMLRGPGIGDDCRGLTIVLAVARALEQAQVRTRGTMMFVGTVGEEGAGNLRGVRHLFDTRAGRARGLLHLGGRDGAGADQGRRGQPPLHRHLPRPRRPQLRRLRRAQPRARARPRHREGAGIAGAGDPRVTFSVGIVEGGTSVNSIAMTASMQVDMRSVDAGALDSLDARFQAAIRQALDEENARWTRATG